MKASTLLSLDNRVWSAGFFNVMAMALQLWAVVSAGDVSGVSRGMLIIFLFVQATFAQVGWREKVMGQFWGMLVSFAITFVILILTFIY